MSLDTAALLAAVVAALVGAVAWWRWRRRVTDQTAVAIDLLRAILAALRRPTPPGETTPDDYPSDEP